MADPGDGGSGPYVNAWTGEVPPASVVSGAMERPWIAFLVLQAAASAATCVLAVVQLRRQHVKLNFRAVVLLLVVAATACRAVWTVDPVRHTLFPPALVAVLQRLSNALLFVATVFLTAMWLRVVSASRSVHRIRSRVTIGKYKFVLAAVVGYLLIATAVSAAGAGGVVEPVVAAWAVRVLYALMSVPLVVMGVWGVHTFHNFLAHGTPGWRQPSAPRSWRAWWLHVTVSARLSCVRALSMCGTPGCCCACACCRTRHTLTTATVTATTGSVRHDGTAASVTSSGGGGGWVGEGTRTSLPSPPPTTDAYIRRAARARVAVILFSGVVVCVWAPVFAVVMAAEYLSPPAWLAYMALCNGVELQGLWTVLVCMWMAPKPTKPPDGRDGGDAHRAAGDGDSQPPPRRASVASQLAAKLASVAGHWVDAPGMGAMIETSHNPSMMSGWGGCDGRKGMVVTRTRTLASRSPHRKAVSPPTSAGGGEWPTQRSSPATPTGPARPHGHGHGHGHGGGAGGGAGGRRNSSSFMPSRLTHMPVAGGEGEGGGGHDSPRTATPVQLVGEPKPTGGGAREDSEETGEDNPTPPLRSGSGSGDAPSARRRSSVTGHTPAMPPRPTRSYSATHMKRMGSPMRSAGSGLPAPAGGLGEEWRAGWLGGASRHGGGNKGSPTPPDTHATVVTPPALVPSHLPSSASPSRSTTVGSPLSPTVQSSRMALKASTPVPGYHLPTTVLLQGWSGHSRRKARLASVGSSAVAGGAVTTTWDNVSPYPPDITAVRNPLAPSLHHGGRGTTAAATAVKYAPPLGVDEACPACVAVSTTSPSADRMLAAASVVAGAGFVSTGDAANDAAIRAAVDENVQALRAVVVAGRTAAYARQVEGDDEEEEGTEGGVGGVEGAEGSGKEREVAAVLHEAAVMDGHSHAALHLADMAGALTSGGRDGSEHSVRRNPMHRLQGVVVVGEGEVGGASGGGGVVMELARRFDRHPTAIGTPGASGVGAVDAFGGGGGGGGGGSDGTSTTAATFTPIMPPPPTGQARPPVPPPPSAPTTLPPPLPPPPDRPAPHSLDMWSGGGSGGGVGSRFRLPPSPLPSNFLTWLRDAGVFSAPAPSPPPLVVPPAALATRVWVGSNGGGSGGATLASDPPSRGTELVRSSSDSQLTSASRHA